MLALTGPPAVRHVHLPDWPGDTDGAWCVVVNDDGWHRHHRVVGEPYLDEDGMPTVEVISERGYQRALLTGESWADARAFPAEYVWIET